MQAVARRWRRYLRAPLTPTHGALPPPITDRQALRVTVGFAAIRDGMLRRALVLLVERAASLERAKLAKRSPPASLQAIERRYFTQLGADRLLAS